MQLCGLHQHLTEVRFCAVDECGYGTHLVPSCPRTLLLMVMKHDGEELTVVSAQIVVKKMSRRDMLTDSAVHGVWCTLVKTSV